MYDYIGQSFVAEEIFLEMFVLITSANIPL